MELELNIKTEDKITCIRKISPLLKGKRCYIFFDEPWSDIMIRFPDTNQDLAIRIATITEGELTERPDVNSDLEGFGHCWESVRTLFEDATQLLFKLVENEDRPPLLRAAKIIHCILNNLGYNRWDEARAYLSWAGRARYLAIKEDKHEIKRGYSIRPLKPRGTVNI